MPPGHAVYGVNLLGLVVEPTGPPAPEAWPRWTIDQIVGPADDSPGMSIWEAHARIGIPGTGELRLRRLERRITLHTGERWSDGALLHPGLSPAAAIIARWMGRSSWHAAAVVIDGSAWGILAERGGGKSTTAALLAGRGCALLTDDLLVVEHGTCFAGPGAVDLREDAAKRLGGVALGQLGTRRRWRKPLPVSMLEAHLTGWIALEWSSGPSEIVTLDVGDRLQILSRHAGLPPSGEHLLELAARPMLRWRRSRSPTGGLPSVHGLLGSLPGVK